MAIYLIQGKLGTGKSKWAVRVMQNALLDGKRVATNIDLQLQHLVPRRPRASYVRLPDKPTAADLLAMGPGNPETYEEDRNGVLVLDELASWLNSRAFGDKDRAPVLDWLIHARKHGWDVYFICQSAQQIDKQVRESLCEYTVNCLRLDKIKLPLLGLLGITLPRCHAAVTRLGNPPNAITVDRDIFQGKDLHAAYDTRQIFTSNYPHGPHSHLAPEYFDSRPPKRAPLWLWLVNLLLRPFATLAALRSGAARVRTPVEDAIPTSASPKLAYVGRLMQLPPEDRIPALRRLWATGYGG